MDWIPSFELGIYNAWILQVIYFIVSMQPLVLKTIFKGNFKKEAEKLRNISPTNVKKTLGSVALYWTLFIIFIASFVLTFFLPLKMDSYWFYIGIFLFLVGIFLTTFVIQSWISTAPNKPITSGIYKYSRHPMYISFFFSYMGIVIATLSWVFLVLTLIHIFLTFFQARIEEKFCISKYGKEYEEYMRKTSRWIGFHLK